MRNTNKKILFILLIFLLVFMSIKTKIVYATTEADELRELLDEYEEDLGDLKQLKEVVDETYDDLYTATKVDDALKEKLNADIDKFDNIDGINPLIKAVLEIELRSQVDNLTDENIDEMREEISVIKEWVDDKVGNGKDDWDEGFDTDLDDGEDYYYTDDFEETIQENPTIDKTLSGQTLPKAGTRNVIIIISIIITIGAIFSIIRYIQLKEIK